MPCWLSSKAGVQRMSVTTEKIDFKGYPDQIGKSGESTWQNRGGHRLWVAPEAPPDSPITYAADNFPVKIKLKAGAIEATPPLESESGLQKQIVLKMAASGSGVEV